MRFRELISLVSILLPWPLHRAILVHVLGYKIDRSAKIGFSLICPTQLEMGPKAIIGHLTLCKWGVDLLKLEDGAIIGNLNWITAVPLKGSPHFGDGAGRRPELVVHWQAAITNRHFIDCTASVSDRPFRYSCRMPLSHSDAQHRPRKLQTRRVACISRGVLLCWGRLGLVARGGASWLFGAWCEFAAEQSSLGAIFSLRRQSCPAQ